MIRAWVIALALALSAQPVAAQPEHGMIRNHTGLPLTFPLQVRTDPGRDYALVLLEDATGDRALTAYIEGGRFFRVLTPPGRYRLHLASGTRWVGEGALFGPETVTIEFDEILDFHTEGLSRKTGHLVDLRGSFGEDVRLDDIALCGGLSLTPEYLDWLREDDRDLPPPPRFDRAERFCRPA